MDPLDNDYESDSDTVSMLSHNSDIDIENRREDIIELYYEIQNFFRNRNVPVLDNCGLADFVNHFTVNDKRAYKH